MAATATTRRGFLGAGLTGALALATRALAAEPKADEEVSPGEDLMREHGVLRRVLLAYDEIGRRNAAREAVPLDALSAGAGIVRRFVEDYHERIEEDFVFPRLRKAGKLTGLVDVLLAQHRAGRVLTDRLLAMARRPIADDAARRELATALSAFTRMYRPHAAREDTELFPAFHEVVNQKAYRALGEEFEERETKVLGEGGFERAVREVARLEEALGIHDLARFTP